MRKLYVLPYILLLLAGCAGGPGAPDRDHRVGQPRSADEYVALLTRKLHLTPNQEVEVRPILQEDVRRRWEIERQYQDLDHAARRARMEPELAQLRDQTGLKLSRVLSPVQMEVWSKLQERGGGPDERPGGRGGRGRRGSGGGDDRF